MATPTQSPALEIAENLGSAAGDMGQLGHVHLAFSGNCIVCAVAALCFSVALHAGPEALPAQRPEVALNQNPVHLKALALPANLRVSNRLGQGQESGLGKGVELPALVPAKGQPVAKPESGKAAPQGDVRPEPKRNPHQFPFEIWFYVTCPILTFLLGYFLKSEFGF